MRAETQRGIRVAALAALVLIGATGVATVRPVSGDDASATRQTLDAGVSERRAAAQPAQQPRRRELIEALAALANVRPRDLRAAAEQHGGLLPALQAFGVGREQVLSGLTEFARARYAPAVAEGRLSEQQAQRLAEAQARRVLRRLGGLPARGR